MKQSIIQTIVVVGFIAGTIAVIGLTWWDLLN